MTYVNVNESVPEIYNSLLDRGEAILDDPCQTTGKQKLDYLYGILNEISGVVIEPIVADSASNHNVFADPAQTSVPAQPTSDNNIATSRLFELSPEEEEPITVIMPADEHGLFHDYAVTGLVDTSPSSQPTLGMTNPDDFFDIHALELSRQRDMAIFLGGNKRLLQIRTEQRIGAVALSISRSVRNLFGASQKPATEHLHLAKTRS